MMDDGRSTSRRQFLRRGVGGACLFGLGAAAAAGGMKLFGPGASSAAPALRPGKAGGLTPIAEFDADLAKLRKTDPSLVKYREAQRIATGFTRPRDVAVAPDGRVYVAGDKAVRIFAPDGTRQAELACTDAARCVAVAEDGTIYAGTTERVEVFDPKGARMMTWAGFDPAALLTALAIMNGEVYAGDARNRIVVRLDHDGKIAQRIGQRDPGRNIPGFDLPSPYLDLAPSPPAEGVLWATNPGNHHVEAYALDGDFVRGWGVASARIDGFCGCCNPTHLARLPDGRFVTSEKGLARVKVYEPDGKFVAVVAGCEAFDPDVRGLALAADAKGRVHVADPATQAIRVFEPV